VVLLKTKGSTMRTETIERPIYKFEELSDRAKEIAIQSIAPWDAFNPDEYSDCFIDTSANGIKSWSMGYWNTNPIEARFSRCDLDYDYLIANMSESLREQRNLYRIANHAYYSYQWGMDHLFYTETNRNYRNTRLDICAESPCRDRSKRIDSLVEKYREKLESHLRDCEHTVAKAINADYEYQCSEENVRDLCECNGYEFTEDGELV